MTFTRSKQRSSRRPGGRRGSVLVVVLALLSALMLLGFLFYTIASQERENARYFTASEKWYAAQLSPDELFDFALEQVIVGPQDDLANSALWGGRYSLLASLVGDDLQPYSGRGVNVIDTGGATPGRPAVDQDQDGVAEPITAANDTNGDGVNDLLSLDVAGLTIASGGAANLRTFFARPDVAYTYPDLNSPFLAYVGTEPMTGKRVVIPSFHRPQYLRGLFTAAPAGAGGDTIAPSAWYTNAATLPYVLRPHAARTARVFNYGTGLLEDTGVERYLGGAGGAFFTENLPSPGPAVAPDTAATTTNRTDPVESFWDWDGTFDAQAFPNVPFNFDADPDGDVAVSGGMNEAVWLDLDHPVEETPDGTEKFIPLFGITIYDLDGLLNVNAHGNHSATPATLATLGIAPATPFDFLSKANEGRRRNEVNTEYAWVGSPGPTQMPAGADYTQHTRFFGSPPTTPTQLANMEWWFILAGRGELDSGGKATQLYTGRYGEANRLNAAISAASMNPYDYSRPGLTASDEAAGVADGNRGSAFTDVNGQLFPQSMIFPAPRHPADYVGRGTTVQNDGKTPLVIAAPATLPPGQQAALAALGRVRVPIYQNFWLPLSASGIGPVWSYALGATFPGTPATIRLVSAIAANTGLTSADGRLVDDPGETLLDSELARDQVTDSIFGPDEAAALHMTAADRTNNSIVSRLIKLAPANFGDATTDNLIRRKRLTTTSSDLKAYAATVPVNAVRAGWEIEAVDPAYPNVPTFPPRVLALTATGQFDPLEPIRQEARGLLASLPNMTTAPGARIALKQLSRKLSVNHVASAYVGRDGQPRFLLRPLTPHPLLNPGTGLPVLDAAAVAGPPGVPSGLAGIAPRFAISDQQLYALEANDNDYLDGYLPAYIPTIAVGGANVPSPALQEWHARRDRQNLARDIYTLLYTFGHPNPAIDTTSTANTPIGGVYSTAQLLEMAQFAVNVVDAMDPDDAITCFVFDTDLSNGYTPFDDGYVNPVTALADRDDSVNEDNTGTPTDDLYQYVDAAGGRGMVYGVEAQQLAFGEGLALLAEQYAPPASPSGTDHGATDWDDSEFRDFTYVELQNMTATPVLLRGGWSVVAKVTSAGAVPINAARAVTIKTSGASLASIAPGTVFTVGTAGDANNTARSAPSDARTPWDATSQPDVRPSHFSVDLDGTATTDPANFTDYQQIAPVVPLLNFDMMLQENTPGPAGQQSFRMNVVDAANPVVDQTAFGSVNDDDTPVASGTSPKAGGWLFLGPQTDRGDLAGGGTTVTFYLRRRANLNRTTPAETYPAVSYTTAPTTSPADPTPAIENDNPWIIVDTLQVQLQSFDPASGSGLPTAVSGVIAQQRVEPLSGIANASPNYSGTTYDDRNNLGVTSTGGAMQYWQRHFDRPFASLADLLTVPLYGPREVTEGNLAVNSIAVRDPRQTAAANVLFPDANPLVANSNPRPLGATLGGQLVPGALAAGYPAGNLWYRLLEFIEVPQKHGDNDSLPWFADYGGPAQWLSDPAGRQDWLREKLRLREFGKLNLNTMRHPHALAGLLDDPRVFSFQNDRPRFANPAWLGSMPASAAGGGANFEKWLLPSPGFPPTLARDWWVAMLASRDGGYDPYSQQAGITQNLILPGVPSARPFLDFGSAPAAGTPASIGTDFQRTLLRSMPADTDGVAPLDVNGIEGTAGAAPNPVARRSLFELGDFGTSAPFPPFPVVPGGGTLGSNAEFSTRYRLLGKVLNHGTTRSNTYVAFIQCDFFEAMPAVGTTDGNHDGDDATPVVYQIGAKRSDSPGYRGVFVIDRTLALELLRRRDLPPNDQGLQYPANSQYRTYSFAREPGPDQRPEPTFDWQDLIQYRRVLAQ